MAIPPLREARAAPPIPVPADVPARADAPSPAAGDAPTPFARLLRGLGHEVQGSETTVHQAIASARLGGLSAADLIVLQAGVYRYSESVDLASRLVENATSAVKTVIQGQ